VLTVVIDTTVLGGDWLLRGAAAEFLVAESSRERLILVVPELVIREAVNLYRRKFESSEKALRSAVRDHRKLAIDSRDLQVGQLSIDLDSQQATDTYEGSLRERLEKIGAEIAPIPDVAHDKLITRALAGHRPFDPHGHKGYRDALIWHTVLEVSRRHGRVVFISNNVSDFAVSKKEPAKLAARLREDVEALRDAGYLDAQVDLRSTPSMLVQMDYPPEEGAAVALRNRLKRERDFRLRVAEQLDSAWTTSWPEWEVEGDIEVEWEDSDLDLVGDVRDFAVDFSSAAKGDELFIQLSGHADIQVAYTIKGSLTWYDDPPEILDGIDWNEYTDTGRYVDVVPAALTFEALYTPGAPELRNVELTKISEAWDWVVDDRVLGGPVDPSTR
jgi:hypothetical protein